jgi:hypothetical protein
LKFFLWENDKNIKDHQGKKIFLFLVILSKLLCGELERTCYDPDDGDKQEKGKTKGSVEKHFYKLRKFNSTFSTMKS